MYLLLERSVGSVYGLKQLMVINFLQRNGNARVSGNQRFSLGP